MECAIGIGVEWRSKLGRQKFSQESYVMSRVTENSVSTIEFYRLFLTKVMDYVEIYAGNWEKIIKKFTISTIFKGPHYFY